MSVSDCRFEVTALKRLSFLLVLGLAACGRPHPGQSSVCSTDAECKDGSYCDAGLCKTGNPDGQPQTTICHRDNECAAEDYCAGGVCKPRDGGSPTGECERNNDCTFGLYCNPASKACVECLTTDHCVDLDDVCRDDGTCGAPDAGCLSDQNCPGQHCDDASGECVQCVNSGHCPSGQSCRNNLCVVDSNNAPGCTQQSECDIFGRVCDLTSQQCVACVEDVECGTGRRCAAGTCTNAPDGGGGGGGTGECASREDCGGFACFLGTCSPCLTDAMCLDFMDILTGAELICDGGTGTCKPSECSWAGDCAPGEACWFDPLFATGGHCGNCETDDECRQGEVCDNNQTCSTPTAPDPECTTSAQCTDGLICKNEQCTICTQNAECSGGNTCQSGHCKAPVVTPNPGQFGAVCSATAPCSTGLYCLNQGGQALCTHPCTGSGKGSDNDCPSGWACYDFDYTQPLDGTKLCVKASQLDSDAPGQGFTQAPGAACTASNAQCQTGSCYASSQGSSNGTCGRACIGNGDCKSGEVCYAEWTESGAFPSGQHMCYDSDTTNYKSAGASCSNGLECDSGLCAGWCSDSDTRCNSDNDCGSGESCEGKCVDHCRSNADCSSSQACFEWPTYNFDDEDFGSFVPVCQTKATTGTKNDGQACGGHGECKSNWCIGSICTTLCATSADCTGGLAGKSCKPTALSFGSVSFTAPLCQ